MLWMTFLFLASLVLSVDVTEDIYNDDSCEGVVVISVPYPNDAFETCDEYLQMIRTDCNNYGGSSCASLTMPVCLYGDWILSKWGPMSVWHDCVETTLSPTEMPIEFTCYDEMHNGNEEGVDCGGDCPLQCPSKCENYNCGETHVLIENADTVYCATYDCDEPSDLETCCDEKAVCSTLSGCGGFSVLRIDAETTYCISTECDILDDREQCCTEPSSCEDFELCDSATQYLKSAPETLLCDSEVCGASDIGKCCENKATCSSYSCDYVGGLTLNPNSETIYCALNECVDNDSDVCCVDRGSCSQFECDDSFYLDKTDKDSLFCSSTTCMDSDWAFCCDQKHPCQTDLYTYDCSGTVNTLSPNARSLYCDGTSCTSPLDDDTCCPPVGTDRPTVMSTPIPTPLPPPVQPTDLPTIMPTPIPTPLPSPVPTWMPTWMPTPSPTPLPSSLPTTSPTVMPTLIPTPLPSSVPTTDLPTIMPTSVPTPLPSPVPTRSPTPLPSPVAPTDRPTVMPTPIPTLVPTTDLPTLIPTSLPSSVPTWMPTRSPTPIPTPLPSPVPTDLPTIMPTPIPTPLPSPVPTTDLSTIMPTPIPTPLPSPVPTGSPTPSPVSTTDLSPVPTVDCGLIEEWTEERANELCPGFPHRAYGVELCNKHNWPDYQKWLEFGLANELYSNCRQHCVYDYGSYNTRAFEWDASCYKPVTKGKCLKNRHHGAMTAYIENMLCCIPYFTWDEDRAEEICPDAVHAGKSWDVKVCGDPNSATKQAQLDASLANHFFTNCASDCVYNYNTVINNIKTDSNNHAGFIWRRDNSCWEWVTHGFCFPPPYEEFLEVSLRAKGTCEAQS